MNLDCTSNVGQSLSVEERAILRSSLSVQQSNGNFTSIVFWGKVLGVDKDYLIAQGTPSDDLFSRVSLYSTDGGVSWSLLQKTDNETRCQQLRGPFTGNPSYEYKFVEDIPQAELDEAERREKEEAEAALAAKKLAEEQKKAEAENEGEGDGQPAEEQEKEPEPEGEDSEENKKPKKRATRRMVTIREEERLAFVVQSIDEDCSVVPRGALTKREADKVTRSATFQGLDNEAAGKLESYVHARAAKLLPKKTLIERQNAVPTLDFMDSLDEDVPNGAWTLQYDANENCVKGASLLWPGYSFHHQPNAHHFGAVYFGNGEKNLDLCFML